MKQAMIILLIKFLYFIPAQVIGQAQNNGVLLHPALYNYSISADSFTSNVPLNEINAKAFRHLLKHFPAVANEKWVRTSEGFAAVFNYDSIRTRVFYNYKGDFIHSIKTYKGAVLSRSLKALVNRAFPDYDIGMVNEHFDGHYLFYGITVTKDDEIKSLELSNNEIRTLEEFSNP
jgi:hypothetical protein